MHLESFVQWPELDSAAERSCKSTSSRKSERIATFLLKCFGETSINNLKIGIANRSMSSSLPESYLVSFVCRGCTCVYTPDEATKSIIILIFVMRAADLGCAHVQTKSCGEAETCIFVSNRCESLISAKRSQCGTCQLRLQYKIRTLTAKEGF